MGGGLMQLVAYGAQDIYLTGNPQITFFKVVYRRHTNFSMESIAQTWNGNVSAGNSVTATISRNGDLVHRLYLEANITIGSKLPDDDATLTALGNGDDEYSIQEVADRYTNNDTPVGDKAGKTIGYSLIKECEIEIGGQRIDRHSGLWMSVYDELTNDQYRACLHPSSQFTAPAVEETPDFQGASSLGGDTDINGAAVLDANGDVVNEYETAMQRIRAIHSLNPGAVLQETNLTYEPNAYQNMICGYTSVQLGSKKKVLLPLQFWFCRNPGLSLPLIALQYHEVKVKVDFQGVDSWAGVHTVGDGTSLDTSTLWADYIYLDTDERRRFAQVSHEYLIEQVQTDTRLALAGGPDLEVDPAGRLGLLQAATTQLSLNFNHPVKELIWCGPRGGHHPCNLLPLCNSEGTLLTNLEIDKSTVGLKLNGHDRFSERDMGYFTKCQPQAFHTNTPLQSRIGVYSFALKPEEHQPSGTCNFSRIDNAVLKLKPGISNPAFSWTVFAVNYNVLRIMSGMGGLAYSN
tara:strand:- start:725 stop:2278 length:1554 start_codon:yes stop_codon:yes gene_type:complete